MERRHAGETDDQPPRFGALLRMDMRVYVYRQLTRSPAVVVESIDSESALVLYVKPSAHSVGQIWKVSHEYTGCDMWRLQVARQRECMVRFARQRMQLRGR